jgi:TniQ
MSRANSGFLIRPKPHIGESLSSWRQRSGWMNGYRLYPTPDERTRRVDSDVGLQTKVMTWLANSHLLSVDDLSRMTLNGYVGRVVEKLDSRDQPRWWLRARYGNSARSYGPMFCPQCLATDEEAYFRLNWRFGFVTSCVEHGCDLIDCCPSCGSAPWPSGLGVKGNISSRFTTLRNCWHCGFDLGLADVNLNSTALTAKFLEGLSSGRISVGQSFVSILDALNSLWAASQIFLRKRVRDRLMTTAGWSQIFQSVSQCGWSERTVEALRVQDRRVLLELAWEIIRDKEESFSKFCTDSGLRRFHFDGAMDLQPAWMNAVIERELPTRQRPIVDESEILEFAEKHQQLNGRLPRKYELRKVFGIQSNRVLNSLTTIPDEVIAGKFVDFCLEIKNMLREARLERALHFKHCTFDLAALLVSLLEEQSLKAVVVIPANKLIHRLRQVETQQGIDPTFKDVVRCVVSAVDQIALLNLKPIDGIQLRQVRKRRAILMKQLMVQSLKDHQVFVSNLKMVS